MIHVSSGIMSISLKEKYVKPQWQGFLLYSFIEREIMLWINFFIVDTSIYIYFNPSFINMLSFVSVRLKKVVISITEPKHIRLVGLLNLNTKIQNVHKHAS